MTIPRRLPRDAGVSMVELLVGIIVVGILAAIAVPVFRDQQLQHLDRVIVADLERYATGAERAYSSNLRYPTTPAGFSLSDNAKPTMGGTGNQYRAFVVPSGARAGWVVYGRSSRTGNTYVLSSYDDGQPRLIGTSALPLFPPLPGTYGIPTSVTPGDWADLTGAYWGDSAVWVPTEAVYPVMTWTDPTFANTTKAALNTTSTAQAFGYSSAPFRIVDIQSQVAERAIEVVTDSGTQSQGIVLMRAPYSATLPADVLAAGERWTVSAFVKAPSGTLMTIGCRYITPAGAYVGSASTTFTASGSWQRPAFACPATTVAITGSRVAVQVLTKEELPDMTFYVTAPQVNKGTAATPFKPQ